MIEINNIHVNRSNIVVVKYPQIVVTIPPAKIRQYRCSIESNSPFGLKQWYYMDEKMRGANHLLKIKIDNLFLDGVKTLPELEHFLTRYNRVMSLFLDDTYSNYQTPLYVVSELKFDIIVVNLDDLKPVTNYIDNIIVVELTQTQNLLIDISEIPL